jgi:hypothetical protein
MTIVGEGDLAGVVPAGKPGNDLTAAGDERTQYILKTVFDDHDYTSHKCVRPENGQTKHYDMPCYCLFDARAAMRRQHQDNTTDNKTGGGAQSDPRVRVIGIYCWGTVPLNQRDGGRSQRQGLRIR